MSNPRTQWIKRLWTMVGPVLEASAAGQLHERLPLRCAAEADSADRMQYTHLEAVARALAGLAPWLDSDGGDAAERQLRQHATLLAQQSIANALDPAHSDHVNVAHGQQPIVDLAFLAHALLRAPRALTDTLTETTRSHLANAFAGVRDRLPYHCNWLLFSALIEAGLLRLGKPWDPMRVDHALRSHELWYAGDGAYGDGSRFHWDYYNSFVIQPMLVDLLASLPEPAGASGAWSQMRIKVDERFRRAAAVQERMIAADGSFPPIGRSLTYRCGAFQHLAQAALQHRLPAELAPAQVRCALEAMIARTLDPPGTYDSLGWLLPGLCGNQAGLMENYISTGSLYLASTAFLPLGLPDTDLFWTTPDEPWTQMRIWRGDDAIADHALYDAP